MVDIAEITKYETEGNVVLEENKNTMKCKMKKNGVQLILK